MLSIRHKTMLEFILACPDGIRGKQLSGQLRVSGKTVRNDISAVNRMLKEEGLHICASQKRGYYIEENDRKRFSLILEERDALAGSREAETPEERRFAILDKVLGHPGIGIDKIAEYLYVSEPTVYKDIAYLEQKLRNVFGYCGLKVKNHRLYLQGTEEEKRRLVFRVVWACICHSGQLMDGNLRQLMRGIVNLHEIYAFCEQVERYAVKNGIEVPQQTLFAGAWMIFYVNVRREEAYFLEEGGVFGREDQLGGFLAHMDRTFFLEFEDCDLEFLYQALRAVGFPADAGQETEKAQKLSERFMGELRQQRGLVFLEEKKETFVQGLRDMLMRAAAGYQLCDWWPWDRERERMGRDAYEAGVLLARLAKEHMELSLTGAEVCRIGEYVQACTRKEKGRVRILAVYGGDMGWHHMVCRWFEERLGDIAVIFRSCPPYLMREECARNQPDVILGPGSLQVSPGILCMEMPGALNLEEEQKVRRFLEKIPEKEKAAEKRLALGMRAGEE
ncbi:MAG: HTH domain-containing protein [Hungatella sp.]|nr:HTH domain-containing protein [Hungatella sp.]